MGNLLNYARSGQCDDIGVLGCWLLDREGLPNNAFGFFPNVKNEMKYLLGKYPRPDSNMISKEKDVDYITGADMFMRKTLFDRMGDLIAISLCIMRKQICNIVLQRRVW